MAALLDNNIAVFFRDLLDDVKSSNVDPNMFHYYGIGLAIGFLLVTALIWFPGEPLGIPYGKYVSDSDENAKGVGPNDLPKEEFETLAADTTRTAPNNSSNVTSNSATKSSSSTKWAGDKIPKEHLNNLQKKFKLSNDQMKQVMDKSKREHQTGIVIPAHEDTFHRDLNRLVYVVIIFFLVYVVNRDYKDFLSFWFARYFPVEAGTLGLFVPVPKSNTA